MLWDLAARPQKRGGVHWSYIPSAKSNSRRNATHCCGIPAVALLVAGLACGSGTARADTSTEFWPELDVWIRINDSLRAMLQAAGTRDRDTGERVNSEKDIWFDYRLNEEISFRTGYNYAVTPPSGTKAGGIDRRFVFDFDYRWKFYPDFALTARTRLESGDDDGTTYRRVHERLRLEYTTHVHGHEVTPYADVEPYYDTRYNALNRWRIELGASTPIAKCVEIDAYVARQRDTEPALKYTNAIGLTLVLNL